MYYTILLIFMQKKKSPYYSYLAIRFKYRGKVSKIKKNPTHNSRMIVLKKVLEGAMNLEYSQLSGFCSLRKIYFNDYVKTDINYYLCKLCLSLFQIPSLE